MFFYNKVKIVSFLPPKKGWDQFLNSYILKYYKKLWQRTVQMIKITFALLTREKLICIRNTTNHRPNYYNTFREIIKPKPANIAFTHRPIRHLRTNTKSFNTNLLLKLCFRCRVSQYRQKLITWIQLNIFGKVNSKHSSKKSLGSYMLVKKL